MSAALAGSGVQEGVRLVAAGCGGQVADVAGWVGMLRRQGNQNNIIMVDTVARPTSASGPPPKRENTEVLPCLPPVLRPASCFLSEVA
jgi:hypothetical protein